MVSYTRTDNLREAGQEAGMGVTTFKEKLDGSVTPMSHMLSVLLSGRYKEVHAS